MSAFEDKADMLEHADEDKETAKEVQMDYERPLGYH
jgi:hypothetical protein